MWVIVDDGCIDSTPRILEQYAASHGWIHIVRIERDSRRELGVTEIRAFAEGYEQAKPIGAFAEGYEHLKPFEYDFIVKLDCDLEIPPDYFERLFTEFQKNERLGIASGVYLEKCNDRWYPVHMPEYHAAGASKVVRRQCFEDIAGFVLGRGWDTIDEIKALMRGWETRHFPDLKFYHLRREGSAIGLIRSSMMHGEIYYLTGGGVLFFLLKVLHRMAVGVPPVLGALAMFWGYVKCQLTGRKRKVSESEARFYRQMLNKRIRTECRGFLSRSRVRREVWSQD